MADAYFSAFYRVNKNGKKIKVFFIRRRWKMFLLLRLWAEIDIMKQKFG